jgi:hypothetical protein
MTQTTSLKPQPTSIAQTYMLGRSDAETRRLVRQHQIYGPITRRLFEAADIGSGAGADWPGYEYVAETLRSLLPALERVTGLDPDEVEIDTLADRMREDAVTGERVQLLPIIIGAWARKPA